MLKQHWQKCLLFKHYDSVSLITQGVEKLLPISIHLTLYGV